MKYIKDNFLIKYIVWKVIYEIFEKFYIESNMGCYSYVDFFLYLFND